MGSLTNLLMRTLLNVAISVNNIVFKYMGPSCMANLTCGVLHVKTAGDNWQDTLQVRRGRLSLL
jgi:hypothetical protein